VFGFSGSMALESLQGIDLGMLFWFQSLHRPWLNAPMIGLTRLGDLPILALVVGVAVVGFGLRGRTRTGVCILIAFLGSCLLTFGTQRVVDRPRPDLATRLIPLPQSSGFPSAHALNATAVFVAIGLALARSKNPRPMTGMLAGATLGLPILVGVSRVYLGVNYPTDVVAGWCGGLVCALLAPSASSTRAGP
jgi:undecaprenyl-diphosphatase